MDKSIIQTELGITVDQRSGVPLYEQICQQFRHMIESHQLRPGAALPTTHELRSRLRVNSKTAQQAMATLAREGYVTRQARRGTVVKGVPRRGVVAIYAQIALLRSEWKYEYYRRITDGLSRLLEEHGRVHRLYLGSTEPEAPNTACDDLLRHLSGGTLCGVLLVNTAPHQEQIVKQGRSMHIPIIAFSGSAEVDYSVRPDLAGFIHSAATSLRRDGRSRIGLIFNRFSRSQFHNPEQFAQLLREDGSAAKMSWIEGAENSEQGGYEAAARLPVSELDGLIVTDDVIALGVDRRLREMRVQVPQALAVASLWHRDSHLRLSLPFERFELDVGHQARLGLQLMQDAINGLRIEKPHLKVIPSHCIEQQV